MIVMVSNRAEKGKEIANGAGITEKQENVFLVPSQANEKKYTVIKHHDNFTCNCSDYHYRMKGNKCKHIHALLYWKDFSAQAKHEEPYTELNGASVSCVHCSGLNVVKNGARKNQFTIKQRYKCKDCNKFFVLNQEFARLKADEKSVCLAMDLYFSGLSLKKIALHLKQFHGVKVHFSTVYRWIEKFMALIEKNVAQIKPEKFSYILHTDETKIKTKMDNWLWCWNSMDSETKFLFASTISKTKYVRDARNHFEEVKALCPDKPAYIFTDGLPAYIKGINKTFNKPIMGRPSNRPSFKMKVKHISNVGLRDKKNNNKIERLHGSQKERLKVMRGVNHRKALEKKMEHWRTYYNYVRPHEGLHGKTPAEASGITLTPLRENKWLQLVKGSKLEHY